MKLLKIDSCSDCKHYSYHDYGDSHCMESNREIDSIGIPDWCTLEDEDQYLKRLTIGDFLDMNMRQNRKPQGDKKMKKTGVKCPICGTEARIYFNVNVHPNDMYEIDCCRHINLRGFLNEEDVLEELDNVILELRG